MRVTKRPLAGAALLAVVLLAGCGGSKASSSPEPVASVASTTSAAATVNTTAAATTTPAPPVTTAASVSTAAPVTAVKPDTAQLDQMLKDLDGQLAAGTNALNDATAAINGGEGDVTP
jgi:hypothetical protein